MDFQVQISHAFNIIYKLLDILYIHNLKYFDSLLTIIKYLIDFIVSRFFSKVR